MRILVLSDRDSTVDLAPIPSLLLTAVVHQHLIREQTRTQVALVVESGDCREVHHVARAARVRRGRGQPVPGLRGGRGPHRHRRADRYRPGEGGAQLRQGARQGRPEDHVQDGHLDRRLLHRRPGLRGGRPGQAARRAVLHRHQQHHRRRRPGRDRRRDRGPARHGVPGQRGGAGAPAARGRRRVPVAPRGRAAPVQPGDGLPAAARHPVAASTTSSASTPPRWTSWRPRPARCAGCSSCVRATAAGADRRGRAGQPRSSSGSPPARCPTARSRPRRTRRWPSR